MLLEDTFSEKKFRKLQMIANYAHCNNITVIDDHLTMFSQVKKAPTAVSWPVEDGAFYTLLMTGKFQYVEWRPVTNTLHTLDVTLC